MHDYNNCILFALIAPVFLLAVYVFKVVRDHRHKKWRMACKQIHRRLRYLRLSLKSGHPNSDKLHREILALMKSYSIEPDDVGLKSMEEIHMLAWDVGQKYSLQQQAMQEKNGLMPICGYIF